MSVAGAQHETETVAVQTTDTPLVELRDATLYFPVRRGILNRAKAWVKALDGVTLTVMPGDALGLVGESGCGKSTLVNGCCSSRSSRVGKYCSTAEISPS